MTIIDYILYFVLPGLGATWIIAGIIAAGKK